MELLKRLEGLSPKRLTLLALELDERVRELERARTEPIAIVGAGCRIPGGCATLDDFWRLLDEGRDAVREIPPDRWKIDEWFDADPDAPGRISSRWGGFLDSIDRFDAPFFGISRREAVSMDPQQRLLLEVCWEALENAGQSPHKLHGTPTGAYFGISTSDYYHMLLARGPEAIDAYLATGAAHSVAAGRVAYTLGLQGSNFPVDTACSSSLVAVHLAIQALRGGECRMALAGGVNALLSPDISIALSRSHMFAPDGRCKAFDSRADGFVRSEGCGVVVLRRLSDAVADGNRILAVIRGSALNQDGRSSGITAPNGASQEAVIRAALANARVEPAAIDYVEAHGTGTSLGDPIEAHALAAALSPGRTTPLAVGSVKTNLGHLEAAAGIAGLIKVVLALQHERIPPHLHFREVNPHIDWKGMPVEIPTAGREWKRGERPRLAGVSSFGFSGTNAHIILEEAPPPVEPKKEAPERGMHVLALSARTETALDALTERYRGIEGDLGDICYTANTGRAHLTERAAYIGANSEELWAGPVARGRAEGGAPEVAFLFTGQGAQYAGMGRELYETEPVFRQAIDRCAKIEPDLIELLYGRATDRLNDTRYTQPAGFALQYALAELWRSWGVEPAVVLGHSVGEYAAACVAGVYPAEEGMRLIGMRGRLTGGLPKGEGAMAAILAPEAEVRKRLGAGVWIAAVNGCESVVVSGRVAEVERLEEEFRAKGVRVERLRVSHAFHSGLMAREAEEFARWAAREIAFGEPRVAWISTVTGAPASRPEPDYWRRQVCEGVWFEKAMQVLAAQGCQVFVEIGPGSTLLGMGQECVGAEGQSWLPSIRRSNRDNRQMAESLAQLYVRGVPVNWDAYEKDRGRRRVALPTYPFERQRYWLEPGRRRRTGDSAVPVFEFTLDLEATGWIRDHRVGGSSVAPAAFYLDLALAAEKDALRLRRPTVADLDLKNPLRPTGPVRLETAIVPEEAGTASFRIYSRAEGASEWTLHATGRLIEGGESASREAAPALPDGAPEPFYEALAARGIDLGNAARSIRRLWSGNGEAAGEVSGSEDALLDGCFQVLGAAALSIGKEGVQVLRSVGRFERLRPLSGRIVARARIEEIDGALVGSLTVQDLAGEVLARAGDIRLAPIALGPARAPRDWFYRLEWQPKPLVERNPAGAVLEDGPRLAAIRAGAVQRAAAEGLDRYRSLRPELERVCGAWAAAALRELNEKDVLPQHARLFARLREMAAEDAGSQPVDPEAACNRLEREYPGFSAEIGLLRRCGPRLAPVLRGEIPPLELLAPGGSFDALDRLYRESPAARVFNPAAREALEAALAAVPAGRPLRIVEIGAGTGGTTASLAPALADREVEYVFTDVSPLFTARAANTFAAYPFFRYALLDIERPPEAQGFTPHSFDVALAANVLHATADVHRTLRHVANLLAPSGLLLLIEGTERERWVDLTFGMTDGWWRFQDTALRPAHALLNRSQWLDLLRAEQFRATAVAPGETSQQVLFLAAAPQAQPRAAVVRNAGTEFPDCDLLVFDATRGASCADLVSVLRTAAALPAPPRIWLATEGVQSSPEAAAHWGIARTAALEYPEFWGGAIDLDPGADVLATVLREAANPDGEDQIAYRSGVRHVLRIVRDGTPSSTPRFQSEGVYLVTGGLGNLGLETARWLVRHGAHRLLLAGRTASRAHPGVAELERLGAEVAVVATDVASPGGVAEIRAALADRRLCGIVHTAATFDRTPLSNLTAETLGSVLRPKVAGAEQLLSLAGADLDFFVLFSSTTALVGVHGMAAYAAANAALDAVAHRARETGVPAVSVNWGTWDLMRGVSEAERDKYRRGGLNPMSSAEALAALGDVLASGAVQPVVASIDWDTLKTVYQSRRHRPLFDAVANAAARRPEKALEPVPEESPLDLATTTSLVRQEVAAVLRLKPAEVDPTLGLFEMGMDSLMSVELKRRLEKRCGRTFPSTLTFNYPNVRALAGYIFQSASPPPQSPPPSPAPDERERLSEDDLAGLLEKALEAN